ncbi:MAG: toll/interleukin-1 receptor domain-containing protein [Gemmatimonadaceae bacterium]|nr:toll/interleukin-1 receptor domain-containing protein [Gemmatimonadaceae bacterium]
MRPPSPPDLSSWEEFDLLLTRIRAGVVVPVVGAELLMVDDGAGGRVHLHDWIARELTGPLGLGATPVRSGFSLNDLVEAFLRQPDRRRAHLYRRVHQLLSGAMPAPPAALSRLAQITDFPLLLSTTFDDLLFRAVRESGRAGGARAEQRSFSPRRADDLDASWTRSADAAPIVYHLFGKADIEPDFALCDEDVLEFLVAMHAEHQSPRRLFDVVRGSNLLFIGCDFPDWLSRFFLRTLKRSRLSAEREQLEVVADTVVVADERLAGFFRRFSYQTYVYPGDAAHFVDELYRRWSALSPAPVVAPMPTTPSVPGRPLGSAEGCVFISYAAEDRPAAVRLRAALVDAGIDVWMDDQRLDAGAAYDRIIEDAIRHCALFLPVVSRNTESRQEGYFRREWRLADERTHRLSARRRFVIPVTTDGVPASGSDTPQSFKTVTWGKAPGGDPTPLVIHDVREAYRAVRREQGA